MVGLGLALLILSVSAVIVSTDNSPERDFVVLDCCDPLCPIAHGANSAAVVLTDGEFTANDVSRMYAPRKSGIDFEPVEYPDPATYLP